MGQQNPPSRPPARPVQTDPATSEFAARVLGALVHMAARGFRAEADLAAALHAAGLPADPAPLRAPLRLLRDRGCITDLLPLADGGLLLTVTGLPIDPPDQALPWLPPDND